MTNMEQDEVDVMFDSLRIEGVELDDAVVETVRLHRCHSES